MLNEIQIEIMRGFVCPYCKKQTKFVNSSVVYGKSYGMIYYCAPCNAYCGVHKGSDISLGRLANSQLRFWKKEAHKYMDMLWKEEDMTRKEVYQVLSEYLNIPPEYCHIGMFSLKTCKEVVIWSKMMLNDLRRLDMDFGKEVKREHFEI